MVIGCIAYVIVVSSNFFPTPYVQIPCNAINGVGAAILWTAQGVYLGRCALWDSRSSTKSVHWTMCSHVGFGATANEYNGVFFSIFQFTGCVGATVCGVIRLFSTGTDTVSVYHSSDGDCLQCAGGCLHCCSDLPHLPPQRETL